MYRTFDETVSLQPVNKKLQDCPGNLLLTQHKVETSSTFTSQLGCPHKSI